MLLARSFDRIEANLYTQQRQSSKEFPYLFIKACEKFALSSWNEQQSALFELLLQLATFERRLKICLKWEQVDRPCSSNQLDNILNQQELNCVL